MQQKFGLQLFSFSDFISHDMRTSHSDKSPVKKNLNQFFATKTIKKQTINYFLYEYQYIR